MAYSAPSSRSTSDLITAAIWNADVVANPIAIYAGAMSVTSQAVGDILYASSTTQFARIAAVATGQVLTSAGTGTVPAYSATPALTSVDMGGTTVYGSRAITVDTGGVLNVVLASSAGDDFTVDTDKLVVSGDSGAVGIGTATPSDTLHIDNSGAAGVLISRINTGVSFTDGHDLGYLRFGGQDADSNLEPNAANITADVAGTWTSSSHPTELQFSTIAASSVDTTLAMTISSSQGVDIAGTLDVTGATTLDSTLAVVGDVVFNDAGADKDFRVESDDDTHALVVIGSSDCVGIGESDPGAKFVVNGTGGTTTLFGDDTSAEKVAILQPGSGGHADRQGNIYVLGTNAGHNDSVALVSGAGTSVDMLFATRRSDGVADTNMILKGDTGDVLIGTFTNHGGRVSIAESSATTNDFITTMVLNGVTSGTAATGVGVGLKFLGSMTGQDGVELGEIGFQNGNVGGAFGDFVVKCRPNATSEERFKIRSDGLAILATKGLTFNAETADANMLDDYEEGTWSPVPNGSTGSAGSAAHNMNGNYTKVGRLVTATCYGYFTNLGSWTGNMQITGYPFTHATGQSTTGSIGQFPDGTSEWRTVVFGENVSHVTFRKGLRMDVIVPFSDWDGTGIAISVTISYYV